MCGKLRETTPLAVFSTSSSCLLLNSLSLDVTDHAGGRSSLQAQTTLSGLQAGPQRSPHPQPGQNRCHTRVHGQDPRAEGVRIPLLSSCQLSLKSEYQERRTQQKQQGRSKETEESKICKVSDSVLLLGDMLSLCGSFSLQTLLSK